MERGRPEHLKRTTCELVSFIFMVGCTTGNYAAIINADDAPSAWAAFTQQHSMRDVVSVEVRRRQTPFE